MSWLGLRVNRTWTCVAGHMARSKFDGIVVMFYMLLFKKETLIKAEASNISSIFDIIVKNEAIIVNTILAIIIALGTIRIIHMIKERFFGWKGKWMRIIF